MPVRYTRFLSSAPSANDTYNCVSMSHISHWGWNSRKCTTRLLFVCQKGLYLFVLCHVVDLSEVHALLISWFSRLMWRLNVTCFVIFTVERRTDTCVPRPWPNDQSTSSPSSEIKFIIFKFVRSSHKQIYVCTRMYMYVMLYYLTDNNAVRLQRKSNKQQHNNRSRSRNLPTTDEIY